MCLLYCKKKTCNELVFPANTVYDGLLDREQELTANRAHSCERECLLSLWQPQIHQLEVNLQKCVLLYLNIYSAVIIIGRVLQKFRKRVQFPILVKTKFGSTTWMCVIPLCVLNLERVCSQTQLCQLRSFNDYTRHLHVSVPTGHRQVFFKRT